jgi:DNA polymerase-3 subunit delta
VKANEAQARAALDRPSPDIRLYLLHGPDEAGAAALAQRLAKALGPSAERVDLDAATLKSDPARLADEAASNSLFGDVRWIRAVNVGEDAAPAAQALLDAERAGNPAVLIAPNVKGTGGLVKLATASRAAMAVACYVPTERDAGAIVGDLAREHGLRFQGRVAQQIAHAAAYDRAIMAREIEKLALFLDAAPDRPQTLDEAVLAAVGADLGEGETSRLVAAALAGDASALVDELARAREAGTSPIVWLRALARRLSSLAEMRGAADAGEPIDAVLKRHRVFWREEAATKQALSRWSAAALGDAHDRVKRAERAAMAPGNAGDVLADHAVLALASARR